jgi:hypothetical protein
MGRWHDQHPHLDCVGYLREYHRKLSTPPSEIGKACGVVGKAGPITSRRWRTSGCQRCVHDLVMQKCLCRERLATRVQMGILHRRHPSLDRFWPVQDE